MNLFSPLPDEARRLMENLPELIEKTFPLPRRFSHKLPHDVAELSALFTSRREEKDASYLGRPNLLSAYLRYFLPWNVYRLCRLLPALPLALKDGDAVTDLGSGPLSLVIALWISRPELRGLNLEFRCIDRTQAVLDAGKKLFEALAASSRGKNPGKNGNAAWTIKTIRGEIRNNGTLSVSIRGNPAALAVAVNIYNEIFWKYSPADRTALQNLASQSAALLSSLCASDGLVLVAEPGIPRSGEFISTARNAFLQKRFRVLSPCPHNGACPYTGGSSGGKGKAKWCHFSFDTLGAPEKLKRLSAEAGIPKDRAVISFLLAEKASDRTGGMAGDKVEDRADDKVEDAASGDESRRGKTTALPQKRENAEHGVRGKRLQTAPAAKSVETRIISDAFPVGEKYGRYGCSEEGAVLALGSREEVFPLDSGSLAELKMNGRKDAKSGALIGVL